jgi:glycosyltransferase involved in cell wall biosynthesis
MLKKSALQFKPLKKQIFLSLFRFFGFHRRLTFHATSIDESQDIKATFGRKSDIITIPNFSGYIHEYPGAVTKQPGELSILFVGRIHPIKNLDYLLRLLVGITGKLNLSIIGMEEDKEYLAECRTIIKTFPSDIEVSFLGEIPNNKIPAIMARHHIFALPTKGENFGHAIFEALSAGKPVLISDQTPWKGLEIVKAGWDYRLEDRSKYIEALKQAISFEQEEYNAWSFAAWQYVKQKADQEDLRAAYQNLLN